MEHGTTTTRDSYVAQRQRELAATILREADLEKAVRAGVSSDKALEIVSELTTLRAHGAVNTMIETIVASAAWQIGAALEYAANEIENRKP